MSYTGKTVSAHFTLHWFVIFLPFSTAFLATTPFTPFFSSLYLPLLLLHAETAQAHTQPPPPTPPKNQQNHKKHHFVRSSRQTSCFCEKCKIWALLGNLVDHDRVYLCSLMANTISHNFLDNPLFFTHCFLDTAKFDGYCQGSVIQPSTQSLQQHQAPKRLPVKLSTLGQKHFWMALRNATELWCGPHNAQEQKQ